MRPTIAAVVTAAACIAVTTAMAGIIIDPDPSKSTVQSRYLSVEGYTVNPPAPFHAGCSTERCTDPCVDGRCGDFVVTARGFDNSPIPGAIVRIDFTQCSDIAIACDQLTAETGQTLPSPGVVQGITDANGRFTFKVQGHAIASLLPGGATSPGTNVGVPCAPIYLDGVPLATEIVSAYDVNGGGTVNGVDAATVAGEVARILGSGAQARARDDYNQNNLVNGADVAIAARMAVDAVLGSGSRTTGSVCP